VSNETTAPVQSLVDEVLAELESMADDLEGTFPGDGDGLHRAADLIRQQQALIAQQAAPVVVPDMQSLVDRFLSWPLPASVRPDECALDVTYPHRHGTNLLTADEAKLMLEHVLAAAPTPPVQHGPLCFCGLPQTKNPHPDAGKPESMLEVGTVYNCIPCLNKSRRAWSKRANKAKNEIADLLVALGTTGIEVSGGTHGDPWTVRLPTPPAQQPVAWTGSGSLAAIKVGAEGFIWGSPAKAHPVPLYAAPPAPEQAEQPIKWGSAGTVGNLIAQLRTIDPGMPVYASLRVKNGVRDGVMLQGLIISYEHGDGRFIVKDGPEKCVVIWTQPDDRQAEQDAEWVEKAMEQADMQVPGELIERIVIAESQGDGPALREAVNLAGEMCEWPLGNYVPSADHDRIVASLRADVEQADGKLRELAASLAATAQERDHLAERRWELEAVVAQRNGECVRLHAEAERLRKDAERYRWLRDHGATASWEEGGVEIRSNPGHLDDAVDESIAIALEASR